MVSDQDYMRHEVLEIIYYLFAVIFMGIIVPIFFGFSARGFEQSFVLGKSLNFGEILTSYMIYYILIVGALFAIIFPIVKLIVIKRGEHPATQENPNWTRIFSVSLIHDPEDGALYTLFRKGFNMGKRKNLARWAISIFRVYIISILVWSGMQILALLNIFKFNLLGIPQGVLQQITPLTKVIFTAEPPATAETGLMLIVLMLLMGINAYFCAKSKMSRNNKLIVYYMVGLTIVPLLVATGWMSWHSLVYSGSSVGLFASFMFGFIGAFLTVLFSSWIIWYVLHFTQNLFNGIKELYPANADVAFYAILAWALLFIIYIVGEYLAYRIRRGSKKKEGYLETNEPTY